MQSSAPTVAAYLASLPADRRAEIEKVRSVVLKSIDKVFAETMQYGMIGYNVPHSVFPAGYHCDPKQPLPFAGLANQKNAMSLYLMGLYVGSTDDKPSATTKWFQDAWKKSGKKLDMGKACIRFKKADDLALDVIAEAFKRMTAKDYIAAYESTLASGAKSQTKKVPAKKAAKKTAKKTAKKVAKQRA